VVELLEYLGSFSILFAAIFYFAGASDRLKQKHYQAWQVINTAQGKGGNGGRIDALGELNDDGISLIGVNVSNAYLQGLRLEKAQARRADFNSSDLRGANFHRASLEDADFVWANLRGADLRDAGLTGAQFDDADLVGARLAGADLGGITLDRADLRDVDLDRIKNWQAIKSINRANILNLRNAPEGFADWAKKKGAVETKSD